MFESKSTRVEKRLDAVTALAPEPKRGYSEVGVFVSAVGKVGGERNVLMRVSGETLHRSFIVYAELMELSNLCRNVYGVDKNRSPAVQIYLDNSFLSEDTEGPALIFPRLVYENFRGRIDDHSDRERILKVVREIFDDFFVSN